jgi:Ni2+-binding GTPase involved in maturation of urease and hydrogenase
VVALEARILAKNDAGAVKNRAWFSGREILALNLVSSPGAGKTTLLERTIRDLKDELPLVCPAMFDLGERAKVVILSVTEGEDKPLKYPHMFRAAEIMILNKTDLLPHVDFDVERAIENARAVNPDIVVLQVSARTGEGLQAWYGWLREQRASARAAMLI